MTNLMPDTPVLTVSQLNQQVRYLLEKSFPAVLIEGEISNFSMPASGHWYFSLKDNAAQVRCAMFRLQNRTVNFPVKDGLHVIVKAKVALYEGRGDFQLVIERMEEAGFGALQKAFDELKNKLEREGLFAEQRKKIIPTIPKQIGVITSATGAAIRDILQVLKHRFPAIPVIIYPTLVQGDEAASQIAKMLELANARNECDVLILARGGGSLEDLWPFNEEVVARAIANSQLPIISGIGHQIDFTIADFVADLRAPTPSAAAASAVPDWQEVSQQVLSQRKNLQHYFMRRYERLSQTQDWLYKRLLQAHPSRQLLMKQAHFQQLQKKLYLLPNHQLALMQNRLQHAYARLMRHHPQQELKYQTERTQQILLRLKSAMALAVERKRNRLQTLAKHLHAISPLATLGRGYAIVKNAEGKLIQEAHDVAPKDLISVTLNKLQLDCEVVSKKLVE